MFAIPTFDVKTIEMLAHKQWRDVEKQLTTYLASDLIDNAIADLKEVQPLVYSVFHSLERLDLSTMAILSSAYTDNIREFAELICTPDGLELYKQHHTVAAEMQKLIDMTKKRDARDPWIFSTENVNHKRKTFQHSLSYKREVIGLNQINYDQRAQK